MLSSNYTYALEKYTGKATRHECPNCGTKNSFTRYVDSTGKYIANTVGKCNRINSCGYHITPREFFKESNNQTAHDMPKIAQQIETKQAVNELPNTLVRSFLNPENANQNNLYSGLIALFDVERVKEAFSLYKVGAGFGTFAGYTVFFQIDTLGKFRAGKLINYDTQTVKRIKSENENPVNWVHSIKAFKTKLHPDYALKQCLFGTHLLPLYPNKPVNLVESEKTALIGSIVQPAALWLATGGANSNLNKDSFAPLKNRNVSIYYDNDVAGKCWGVDVNGFLPFGNIVEWNDHDTKEGTDIGDLFLIQAIEGRSLPPPPPVNEFTLKDLGIDLGIDFSNLDNLINQVTELTAPPRVIPESEFAKIAIQALTELHDRFSYTESALIERLGTDKVRMYQNEKILIPLNTCPTLYKLSDNVMHYYN